MLIAGAIDFVVFIAKRNDYARGGRLRRYVSSVREVTGVDGRVLSSEVFAPGPDGRAVPHAPLSCCGAAGRARLRARAGVMVSGLVLGQCGTAGDLAGAAAGAGLFLLAAAVRGLPSRPPGPGAARARQRLRELAGLRGAAALRGRGRWRWWPPAGWWPVSGWRCSCSAGAGCPARPPSAVPWPGSRRWPTWTESLRDTIAGAVGPGAGHPRLAPRGRARAQRTAGAAGGPAAHPGADARGAAQVRRRPGRSWRGPDHRRAGHQRPAARARGCGTCSARCRVRCGKNWTCAARSTPTAGPPGAACRSWCAYRSGLALGLAMFDRAYVPPTTTCSGSLCWPSSWASTPRAFSGCGGWRGSRPRSGCSPPCGRACRASRGRSRPGQGSGP